MNIRKLISKTVDFRYFSIGLLWSGLWDLFFMVLGIILSVAGDPKPETFAMFVFAILLFSIIAIYYAARLRLLYLNIQAYHLYPATVAEVHNCNISLWRSCYFTLNVRKEDGSVFTAHSNGVFKMTEFSSAYFGDYLNKPLQVLYNPKSETIVVLDNLASV